jgi:hypothetical protein
MMVSQAKGRGRDGMEGPPWDSETARALDGAPGHCGWLRCVGQDGMQQYKMRVATRAQEEQSLAAQGRMVWMSMAVRI